MKNSSNSYFGTHSFTLLVVLSLSLLNFIVYFPSIGGYFLADDFMHINYLSHVLSKQQLLLLTNFHSNWMQAAGTQFYRPLITLFLAFDYLLWGNNAIGFHLSNLFFQLVCTVLIYFLVAEMTALLGLRQSKWIGATTAAFFAVYPLHPEVVSWIIGRVDSIATMFYLAAFLLFLKSESNKTKNKERPYSPTSFVILAVSLFCYFCSMLSKEIGVTLPIALCLWIFMFDDNQQKFGSRCVSAIKQTLPYWICLALYLTIRTMALGTIYGGYTGSVGAALDLSLPSRLMSMVKLVLPFNDELFSPHHLLRHLLVICYILGIALLFIRRLTKQKYTIPYKLVIYAVLWFVICLLPTYQVFDLTNTLQGSRLLYLASIPICFLFSLLLLPIMNSNYQEIANLETSAENNYKRTQNNLVSYLSSGICVTVLLIFACTAYINNLPWRRAGDELRDLQQALLKAKGSISPDQKLVLINIPYTYNGAHMLYNGTTLDLLCSPVLTGRSDYCPIVTLEPVLYGNPDLLNYARLHRLLDNKGRYVAFAWQRSLTLNKKAKGLKAFFDQIFLRNSDSGQLKKIEIDKNLGAASTADITSKIKCANLDFKNTPNFKVITMSRFNISAISKSLLELTIKASPSEVGLTQIGWLQLQWLSADPDAVMDHGSLSKPLIIDGKTHKYLFNLVEHKSWLLCNLISELKICTSPGKYNLNIENMCFINPATIIPQLGSDYKKGPQEDDSGTYHFAHNQGFLFWYDASQLAGAKTVVYEISKPNFWFEHEEETFTNDKLSNNAVIHKDLSDLKGAFTVAGSDLETGYFEVRLAALDKEGKMIGLTSYPVCGQVGAP